jgi:hypothetical protein
MRKQIPKNLKKQLDLPIAFLNIYYLDLNFG